MACSRGKLDDNEDNSIKREMEKKDEEKNQMTWEEGLAKIKDAEMVAQQLVSEIAVSVFDNNVISWVCLQIITTSIPLSSF